MSSASPITDNTLFLYSAITSTKCKIDFAAVGAALNLHSGTAAMRYRRLTERIKKANTPQSSASAKGAVDENSLFLYQCMVASKCKPDWNVVGITTGLKAGTASMRWRRLHNKIHKEHGSTAGLQSNSVSTQPATPAVRAQNATASKKRKTNPAKEESEDETASDSMSDSEVQHKRVKKEGEGTLPEKRQTRGKKLDFKGMAGSSSSDSGTNHTGQETSVYQESSVKQGDDESTSDDDSEKRTPVKQAAATGTKGPPAVEKAKASTIKDPITPPKSAASHSSHENPKPTPAFSATPTQRQRPVPPPLTPVSGIIVRSIESDDQDEIEAQLDGMSDGRFVRTSKRTSQASSKSTRSSEYYEADSEGASTSVASSLQAQAPTESDFLDADDIESVAPDDSISMIGKASQGGLKRQRKVNNKKEGILGKLWGLFG